MAKLKSSLTNMLLSLTLIALVAAGLLAAVYNVTKDPIELAKATKQAEAKMAVLPHTQGEVLIKESEQVDGVSIYKAYAGDELLGAAVETQENGFGGTFKIMVGFDKNGAITGYQVLEHQETPGLGSKMDEWFKTDKNRQNVIGLNPGQCNLTVSKDGGDVDAITAATISSRAFLLSITKAYNAYMSNKLEAVSGATTLSAAENENNENKED
ncbi:MAG: RnfABCDGE type electron transport complex subunit G [Paludibacteraceae bacterium]|nr:RnfABCDGE type electron transport complex subunit G [Paludibacteraceae bacterium]